MADESLLDIVGGNTPQQEAPQGSLLDVVGGLAGVETLPPIETEAPPENPLHNIAYSASELNPQEAQKFLKLETELGIPEPIIRHDPVRAERESRLQSHDLDRLRHSHPKLSEYLLENPVKTAATWNDIGPLKKIESNVRDYGFWEQMGMNLGSNSLKLLSGVADLPAFLNQATAGRMITPRGVSPKILPYDAEAVQKRSKELLDLSSGLSKKSQELTPPLAEQSISAGLEDAIENRDLVSAGKLLAVQVTGQIPQFASVFMGPYGIAALAASATGSTYREGFEKTQSGESKSTQDQVVASAMLSGIYEAAFERMGTFEFLNRWALKNVRVIGKAGIKETLLHFGKQALSGFGVEAGEEALTQFAQSGTNKLLGIDTTPFTIEGMGREVLDAALLGGFSGSTLGSIGATVKGIQRKNEIQRTQNLYQAIGESVEAMEAREKLHRAIKETVEKITKDGPVEHIYVDPKALKEYFGEQLPQALEALQAQEAYDKAEENNSLVQIPTSIWASKIAVVPETHRALKDDITFSPNQMTGNEFKLFQSELEQERKKADELKDPNETLSIQDESLQDRTLYQSPERLSGVIQNKARANDIVTQLEVVRSNEALEPQARLEAEAAIQAITAIQETLPDSPETRFEGAKQAYRKQQEDIGVRTDLIDKNMELFDSFYRALADRLPRLGKTPIEQLENETRRLKFQMAEAEKLAPQEGTLNQPGLPSTYVRNISPIGFYSKLEEEVGKMDFKSIPAKDLRNRIANLQGVKKAELEATGILDYLEYISGVKSGAKILDLEKSGGAFPGRNREQIKRHLEGIVTKEDVIEFIKQKGVKVEQIVLSENYVDPLAGLKLEDDEDPDNNDNEDLPEVADLSWDDGAALEPDSDRIGEDVEYNYWDSWENFQYVKGWKTRVKEFLSDLKEKDKDTWKEMKDAIKRLQEIDEKKWDDRTAEERELLDSLYKKFQKNFYHTSPYDDWFEQAYEQAYESHMEGDYVDMEYTEEETGWTLRGNNEYGWYSPQSQETYEVDLEEAKVQILRDMLGEGVIRGNRWQLLKEEDFEFQPHVSYDRSAPSFAPMVKKRATALFKKNKKKFFEKAKKWNNEEEWKALTKKKQQEEAIERAEDELENELLDPKDKRNKLIVKIEHPWIKGELTGNNVTGWKINAHQFDGYEERGEKRVSIDLGPMTLKRAQTKAKRVLKEQGFFYDEEMEEKKKREREELREKKLKEIEQKRIEAGEAVKKRGPNDPKGRARYKNYTVSGGANYREILLTLPGSKYRFRGGHFSGEADNVFAHIRVKDREGNNGKKVLFIEEMQSDWQQSLREAGAQTGISEMPFDQTEAWVTLALKRIIKMAVEQGYDAIDWAGSEVQIKRWGTDSIEWKRGTYQYTGREDTGQSTFPGWYIGGTGVDQFIDEREVTEEAVKNKVENRLGEGRASESIAKAIYKQIKEGKEGKKEPRAEGMKFFYDQLVPKVAEKIVKQLDPNHAEEPPVKKGTYKILLTDALKESVNKGQPLFQNERGSIQFTDLESIISLLNGRYDASTIPHEFLHHWVDQRFKIVERLKTQKEALTPDEIDFINDSEEMLRFAGVSTYSELWAENAKGHELLASEWEKYLASGKAPSNKLRRVFYAFETWLLNIWRKIRHDPSLKVNDNMRRIFDKMLATREEIENASNDYVSLFDDPKAMGMTDTEAVTALKALQQTREAGLQRIRKVLQDEENKEKTLEYEAKKLLIQSQVEEEVLSRRAYVTLNVIKTGQAPNGLVVSESPLVMDKDLVLEAIGKERIKALPSGVFAKGSKDAPGGLPPDFVSEQLGYGSADEMFKDLENLRPSNEVIEEEVNRRMKEEVGDLLLDGGIEEEAVKAMHNQTRARQLRKELEWLASERFAQFKKLVRKIGTRLPTEQEMRSQAEKEIAGLRVRDTTPAQYNRAEIRSGKEAQRAFLNGDFEAAFKAKKQELYNHELYRAAQRAKKDSEKALKYFKSFDSATKWARLGKAGESYQIQADQLLSRFDFKQRSAKKLDQTLNEWVKAQEALGLDPIIAQRLLDETYGKNYKNMTHEEIAELRDALKNIEALARISLKSIQENEARTLEEIENDIRDKIGENYKLESEPTDLTPGFKDKIKHNMKKFMGAHTRMEFFFEALDGYTKHGPVWTALFKPFVDAEAREIEMRIELVKSWENIFSAYSKEEKKAYHTKKFYPELKNKSQTGNLTKNNLIAIALNMGNEGNKLALLEGHGWTEEQILGVLAKELSEKDFKVIEAIWDQVDSYWPEARKLEHDVTGIAPPKIEAKPFAIGNRTLKGGYYPILFDNAKSIRQSELDTSSAIEDAFGGQYGARAMTRHGHLIARKGSGGKPLRLEIIGAVNHINTVIHDITHRRAVIDVNRLIRRKGIKDGIVAAAGTEMYRQLNPWLHNIAGDDLAKISLYGDRFFGLMRRHATTMGLGFNVTSALVQVSSLPVASKEIGLKYTWAGVTRFFTHPIEQWKFVSERSTQMRTLIENMSRDIRDAHRKLQLDKQDYTSVKAQAESASLYLIGYMNRMISVPVWLGAYEKAIDGGVEKIKAGDETKAIAYADNVVRTTQTAGSAKDLAAVERGPQVMRLFTMYYSQMSIIFNQFQAIGGEYRVTKDTKKLLTSLTLIWFAQVAIEQAMRGNFMGLDDDDDDEKKWALVRKFVSFPGATMILVRDLVGAWDWYEKTGRVNLSNPALDAIEKIFKGGMTAIKAPFKEDEMTDYEIKTMVEGAGYLTGLPTRQTYKTLDYLYDWMTGEVEPANALEGIYRSLVTGKPREE